jgi:hypothetical protein
MAISILNLVGMFLTSVGALLIVLYLMEMPEFARQYLSAEGQKAFARHRRMLVVGVGLLAAWIVLQYLEAILL